MCEHAVLTVPTPTAVERLTPLATRGVPLESSRTIGHARFTLVHLGIVGTEAPTLPKGFGYLVPPPGDVPDLDEPRAPGILFVPNVFARRTLSGSVAVSSFYRAQELDSPSETEIVDETPRDRRRTPGSRNPWRAHLAITQSWNDVIPKYAPGHAERMRELLLYVDAELARRCMADLSPDQMIPRGPAVAQSILDAVQRESAP